ncbi:hypothetical protein C8J56DRAFT_783665 [Mycena floridula]|nr:hypothetical protein C8J56DRAFT_783665 [Mycena floridula]
MEHILLECQRPGQHDLWNLAQLLGSQRTHIGTESVPWPEMSLGLVLGCRLARFNDKNGCYRPGLSRFFCILVTETAHAIWKVRCTTVLKNDNVPLAKAQIHNTWLHNMNEHLLWQESTCC